MGRKRLASAIVTSLILVALTLFVFANLRDYGPESTIRRFHEAAIAGDRAAINATTIEGYKNPFVANLVQGIRQLAEQGGQMRIVGQNYKVSDMQVGVTYSMRNGASTTFNYYLTRSNREWRIDARKTKNAIYESLGYAPNSTNNDIR